LYFSRRLWHNGGLRVRREPRLSKAPRERQLERLGQENEQLGERSERLRDEIGRMERERDRLRREIERLTQALAAAQRAGKRQVAPFSKGAPRGETADGRTAGRPSARTSCASPAAAARR
jgi:hypothetical protein